MGDHSDVGTSGKFFELIDHHQTEVNHVNTSASKRMDPARLQAQTRYLILVWA